jgi:hypothetical protein
LFPSFVPRGWCSATVGSRCRLRARYQRNKAVATVFLQVQDYETVISNARKKVKPPSPVWLYWGAARCERGIPPPTGASQWPGFVLQSDMAHL